MDKDERIKQLIIDAQKVISVDNFPSFEREFNELLLLDPSENDCQVRSLKIFYEVLHCDDLTEKLFNVFVSHWGHNNLDVVFLETAYLHLDGITFRHVLDKMVQFATHKHIHSKRRSLGESILEIIRERENMHRAICQYRDIAFSTRFYQKFQFLFEMYVEICFPRYMKLLDLLKEHKTRGFPHSESEIERLRLKANEIFTTAEYPKLCPKLLNYCTRGKVEFPSSNPTDSVSPVEQKLSVPDSNPTADSMTTLTEKCDKVSSIEHNSPVTRPRHPSDLDRSSEDNPEPDSTITIPQSSSNTDNLHRGSQPVVSWLKELLEQSNPVSAESVSDDSFQCTSSQDNLYGRSYPALDLRSYYEPLDSENPQEARGLSIATIDTNLLSGSLVHVESRNARMEVPISDPAESIGTSGVIAKTLTESFPCLIELLTQPTPVSAVPVRHNVSSHDTSIPENLYNSPVLDYETSGSQNPVSMTPVEPPNIEQYPRTSTPPSGSILPVFQPLDSKESAKPSDLSNESVSNELSGPSIPVESSDSTIEEPIRDSESD